MLKIQKGFPRDESNTLIQNDDREIGSTAIWSLSSSKPGFGLEQIRDDNFETYWQSDGPQPHLVTILFPKEVSISSVAIYADFKQDESYTPSKIATRAGTNLYDLQEFKVHELKEPLGWVSLDLLDEFHQPLRTHALQLVILANHQNGKDSHVRGIKVYSPRKEGFSDDIAEYSSPEFQLYATLR